MDRFEDHRGVIQDLFDGEPVAVTRITTRRGAVRGNHVHKLTTQWTYVIDGLLLMATNDHTALLNPGETMRHDPGDAHAWRAIKPTECLVFTKGPRSGENYESDTHRLDQPLLS